MSLKWEEYAREFTFEFESVHFRTVRMMLLFSFCPEEMGKEYKYLKIMFLMYQVRLRASCWIVRVREARLILLLDAVGMNLELWPRTQFH